METDFDMVVQLKKVGRGSLIFQQWAEDTVSTATNHNIYATTSRNCQQPHVM